jgi:hypothetical protein
MEDTEDLWRLEVCECGHPADDHHISWWLNGGRVIEECEYYGFNEYGGMIKEGDKWVEHCQRFRPKNSA